MYTITKARDCMCDINPLRILISPAFVHLQELVMDILRVLVSPDLEVRKKTLDLVLEVVNSRNIGEVVMILKKEITKTHTEESNTEDSGNYRQILVRTLHACSVKFPDVAESVVPVVSLLETRLSSTPGHGHERPLYAVKMGCRDRVIFVFCIVETKPNYPLELLVIGCFLEDHLEWKSYIY